jgi:hypothetical protein
MTTGTGKKIFLKPLEGRVKMLNIVFAHDVGMQVNIHDDRVVKWEGRTAKVFVRPIDKETQLADILHGLPESARVEVLKNLPEIS